METDRHHEFIKPIRELSRSAMEWVVDKVIPQDTFDEFMGQPRGASELLDAHLYGEIADGQDS